MKKDNLANLKSPEVLLASLFGVGMFPKAPGTMGTLATLPFLYWLGKLNFPLLFYLPIFISILFFSCFVIGVVQKKHGEHDPGWIVLDEALGMSIAWPFCQSSQLAHLVILFLLFRFFDIVKIWPANLLDRKVRNAVGIVGDDLVSGIYAGISYYAIYIIFSL